ncbi:FecR family protein [Paraburkholderia caballeronis]|uniref:FecR domain-containing protein n=1 Tax=Paraburkholderia caballeronis TaxID=416943 RepID=UPI00106569E9|nr:FecR domain-containing protein [Paraburkholderia caballeronis]TDV36494.1 FecR family protein [Paraburkholderia caballeronis]
MSPRLNPSSASVQPEGDAILAEALQWLVTLWSGEASRDEHEACERWRRANPAHEAAWQRVQSLDERLGAVPASLAAPTLRGARLRARRRAVLRSLVFAGGTGALTWAASDGLPWRDWAADYRTATGEQRNLVLADGTHLMMNTGTALDVRFTASERRVLLRSGEIYVATAHEASAVYRAFIVETAQGSVQALGTRFTVRQGDALSYVAVHEGAVSVLPAHATQALRVEAGQSTSFFADRVNALSPVDAGSASWTRGQLVVEQMRLDAFVRELGRYRSGFVRTDPAVAALRVSGVFPLADTDRALASLQQALPVRIHYATRYWVTVRPD